MDDQPDTPSIDKTGNIEDTAYEPMEVAIDDDSQDDSLDDRTLDEIWNEAVEEGTRTAIKGEDKAPSSPLEFVEPEEKTPSWEDAFADQSKVESQWRKAQEMDRIQEEQQLAEALGEKYVPLEPPPVESHAEKPPAENKQDLVDQLFAELKGQKASSKEASPPLEEESQPLPSMQERQQVIDQIIQDFRAGRAASKTQKTKPAPVETPRPLPSLEDRQQEIFKMVEQAKNKLAQEKTQEEIDLEEEVNIDDQEDMPSWEEAFAHQAEMESGWKKAEEQNRILEEQQLADALGEDYVPPPEQTTGTPVTGESKQAMVDDIFAQMKGQTQKGQQSTPATGQSKTEDQTRQSEVDRIFAEAKTQQKKTQEEIDLEEEVTIDDQEDMPSWEEAFAHQAEMESGWKKAEEQNRILEEQQLADALGEDYVPPPAQTTGTPVTGESKQAMVDDIFAQMKAKHSASESVKPEKQVSHSVGTNEETNTEEEFEPSWADAFSDQENSEADWIKSQNQDKHEVASSEKTVSDKEDALSSQPISENWELPPDMADLDMKQLVAQAFEEETQSQDKIQSSKPEEEPAFEPEMESELEPVMEAAEEESAPPEPEPMISEEEPAFEPEMESELEPAMEATEEEPAMPETEPVAAEEEPAF
ncbi:MAG: hypothetical protein OEZ51_06435, partial [Nitrospinota bacterium]|nr:hypothetical protein [Nitrospinota bacterium]